MSTNPTPNHWDRLLAELYDADAATPLSEHVAEHVQHVGEVVREVVGSSTPQHVESDSSGRESTCSNLLTRQNKNCAANTRQGTPCRAYRSPASQFCPFHDPEYAERIKESRAEGGRHRPYNMPTAIEPNLARITLGIHDRVGIQASMEAVMRMTLLGRIPPRHAAVLLRYFHGAIRNLRDNTGFEGFDLHRYRDVLEDVLLASGLIERDLEDQSRKERLDQVSDVGARREEILHANETFGYVPPSRTSPLPNTHPHR